MGLFKEECTGIKCDGCGEISNARDDACNDDLHDINGKWYLLYVVYDEELDEYVPNNKE